MFEYCKSCKSKILHKSFLSNTYKPSESALLIAAVCMDSPAYV